jgi:hypothetical protein
VQNFHIFYTILALSVHIYLCHGSKLSVTDLLFIRRYDIFFTIFFLADSVIKTKLFEKMEKMSHLTPIGNGLTHRQVYATG